MTMSASVMHRPRFVDKWLLPISLLLNLFALGVITSPFMPWTHSHPHHHALSVEELTAGFSDTDAKKFRDIYALEEASLDHNHEVLHNAMRNISVLIAAPTPDAQKLQQTLDDIATAQNTIHEDMARLVNHVATDLSPKARQLLSDREWDGNVHNNTRGPIRP